MHNLLPMLLLKLLLMRKVRPRSKLGLNAGLAAQRTGTKTMGGRSVKAQLLSVLLADFRVWTTNMPVGASPTVTTSMPPMYKGDTHAK